jgi:antitoxin (DNA-binding transcriptional repressor) of toxin-antitoxin stability system
VIQVTITQLRQDATGYFDLVEAGETIRVFRNGKPIADVAPISEAFPSWKRRSVCPLFIADISVSQKILEARAENQQPAEN